MQTTITKLFYLSLRFPEWRSPWNLENTRPTPASIDFTFKVISPEKSFIKRVRHGTPVQLKATLFDPTCELLFPCCCLNMIGYLKVIHQINLIHLSTISQQCPNLCTRLYWSNAIWKLNFFRKIFKNNFLQNLYSASRLNTHISKNAIRNLAIVFCDAEILAFLSYELLLNEIANFQK